MGSKYVLPRDVFDKMCTKRMSCAEANWLQQMKATQKQW